MVKDFVKTLVRGAYTLYFIPQMIQVKWFCPMTHVDSAYSKRRKGGRTEITAQMKTVTSEERQNSYP